MSKARSLLLTSIQLNLALVRDVNIVNILMRAIMKRKPSINVYELISRAQALCCSAIHCPTPIK